MIYKFLLVIKIGEVLLPGFIPTQNPRRGTLIISSDPEVLF